MTGRALQKFRDFVVAVNITLATKLFEECTFLRMESNCLRGVMLGVREGMGRVGTLYVNFRVVCDFLF